MSAAAVTWQPAYIGVGSNLNDPAEQVRQACAALDQLAECRLVVVSALYLNPPLGPQDQPDYVNAAAGLLTRLRPAALLAALKGLETSQGRTRKDGDRWGARIIDLDVLVYGREIVNESSLTVPHPGISERNFVLFPLLDIAPTLNIPGQGIVADLAAKFSKQDVERLEN